MKTANDFKGIETLEVWDFRLSNGSPVLYNNGELWRVVINANDGSGVLEEFTTDVPTSGNSHDVEGVKACYVWLHSVRDKYSRDHIELRKPVAKFINESNAELSAINVAATDAKEVEDMSLHDQLIGRFKRRLDEVNAKTKEMTLAYHKAVEVLTATPVEVVEGGVS
jgi:hypothetical protein